MTQESLLTNSQEEQLFKEIWDHNTEDMKGLTDHLDIEPYPSFSNYESFAQPNSFLQAPYEAEQDQSLSSDNKMSLQHQIVIAEHQRLEHQQQLEQQQLEQQQQFLHQQQQQQQQQYIPQQPVLLITPIPAKEEFAGSYNFQLILNHQNASKHWVYSQKLSKVFIHMEQVLPLEFRWEPPHDGLWVRATMVYKLDHNRSQPVVRCHNHMAPDNASNRNINPLQVKHVIRCTHSASSYEEKNGHLSVVTPLGRPEAGVTNVPMDFVFYCKNSCASGMNRRATELIFTLETQENQILGRRKLEIRVCSCPKRDKEKEEGESEKTDSNATPGPPGNKKRKMNHPPAAPPPPGKKTAATDTKVYNLEIDIVGKDNYLAVLRYAHDRMAGSAYRTNNLELYKPKMDEILKKL